MKSEELRHRITIEYRVVTTNENGYETEIWQEYKKVWASVSNLSGREYYEAAAVKAEETVKFTIRYMKGIDSAMRILFKDKRHNIVSIDNIKYRDRFIEIKALEVGSSG